MKTLAVILMLIIPSILQAETRVLFSHQSVGRHIVANPGHYTAGLEASNHIRAELDPDVKFWDHDYYNYTYGALMDADGDLFSSTGFGGHRGSSGSGGDVALDHLIGAAFKDTPDDADALAFRDSCSSRFDIVMIKPGYRDIHMNELSSLANYETMLNEASDWWHDNNPGKFFVVMTSSPLRYPSEVHGSAPADYSSAGWTDDATGRAAAIAAVANYREFDLWLQNVWVCRHPENRYFSTWWMSVEHTGDETVKYFTKAAYKASDHHLNSDGSDAIQGAFVTFINELVETFEGGLPTRRRMTDLGQ